MYLTDLLRCNVLGCVDRINNYLPRITGMSVMGPVRCHMTVPETTYCFFSLNSWDVISGPFRKGKSCSYIYTRQVSLFSFLYPFNILLVNWTISIQFYLLGHICVFFLLIWLVFTYKRLNGLIWVNEFILSFFPVFISCWYITDVSKVKKSWGP